MASSPSILPPDLIVSTYQNTGAQARMYSLLGKKQPATPEQIDKAAQDFEAVFLNQMLEPMFDAGETQWFGGKESEDVFRSLMVQQFGTLLAKSGGVGIAAMVKKELLSLQEVQQAPQTTAVKGQ